MNTKWLSDLIKGVVWEIIGILIMYLITKDFNIIIYYFGIRIIVFVPFNYCYRRIRGVITK